MFDLNEEQPRLKNSSWDRLRRAWAETKHRTVFVAPHFQPSHRALFGLHNAAEDCDGPGALLANLDKMRVLYKDRGYVVVRNFFSQAEVAECRQQLASAIAAWPDVADAPRQKVD